MQMTKQIAYAIGQDAGNKSMRTAGRKVWNEDDFNTAAIATIAALALLSNTTGDCYG
jgi:hypothetical protein